MESCEARIASPLQLEWEWFAKPGLVMADVL